jgi:flagellar biosynthesis/type III secretory pathway protein FliH
LPSVLYTPSVKDSTFILRAPALPLTPEEMAPPLVHTEEEMMRVRAEAERAGREAAAALFEEARRLLEAETRAAADALLETAASLRNDRRTLLEEAAVSVVELAYAVARRVIRREVESDPGLVVPLVRELLQRSAAAAELTVRLSERDYAHLVADKRSLVDKTGLEGLRLRVDSTVEPGGCVVETEAGSLDGRIETQLERIEEALLEAARKPARAEEREAA